MVFYLKSKAADAGDYFCHSLLCIVENDRNGAIGFIMNRPFRRTLNELQEYASLPSFPLYEGGPVDDEHLYFLHCRADIIEEGKPVGNSTFLGGNFKQATEAIAKGIVSESDIRIFIGYCGWDAGELEEEIRAGEWERADTDLFS